MKSFEFENPAIFPEDAIPGDTVAVVHQNTLNLVCSVMTSASRKAGVRCTLIDVGNASLEVCKQLATGFIQLTFLTEDVASHTDANVQMLMVWIKNGCSLFAQTLFFSHVSEAQMKEILGGVTKVMLANKIHGGVPKVIVEDSSPNSAAEGL